MGTKKARRKNVPTRLRIFVGKAENPPSSRSPYLVIGAGAVFAGVAVAHAHHHEDENGYNRRADTHTVKTVGETKRRGEANKKAGIRRLRRGSESRPGGLPRFIICDELGKKSASVEERGDRGGNGDAQLDYFLPGDKNTLLSYASKSIHETETFGPQTRRKTSS